MARGGRGGRGRGRGGRSTASSLAATSRPTDEEDTNEEMDESTEDNNEEEVEPKEVKVDRRKPQLKTKTEPTPEPKVLSIKKPGRPPSKRGRGSSPGASFTPTTVKIEPNNSVNSNSDGEHSESQTESSEPTRKRGRKPKEKIKEEDRYVPNTDSAKRGIMAEGSSSLRRRDQIKSKARYSPPPFDTPKRERGAPIKFPSTTSTNTRYVNESDEEEMVSVSPTFKLSTDVSPPRRKPTVSRTPNQSVVHQIENVGVSKIGDGSKLVVTLPDGSSIKVSIYNSDYLLIDS